MILAAIIVSSPPATSFTLIWLSLTFPPAIITFATVRRLAAIFLTFFFIGLGSGLFHFLHERDHAIEDAREDAIAHAAGKPVLPHDHDDCDECVQFNVLVMWHFGGWMPLLIFFGLFVAFLTLLPISPVSRRAPARIDCRGPPALNFLPIFAV